jgi:cation diffusion facilitator CzcD-associated flavoprotein CzcO
VNDPETAELLIPRNHGFGTRRVPLETYYYEAFNKPNVRLVDIAKTNPITRITEDGVILESDEEICLDVLIHATGFDAGTGSFAAVDFRGVDGIKLNKEAWNGGPKTLLGFFVNHFPNMMMVMGPHQMFGNIPRSIEYAVDWISEFIEYCIKNGITYAEPRQCCVDKWTQHVFDCAQGLLANEIDSWMTGVNKNVKGKEKRIIARYNGPAPGFRVRASDVAQRNYEDLILC